MSKSANAIVHYPFGRESHLIQEHSIHKSCAEMKAFVYEAGKVPATKHRQFQMRLTTALQVATTVSDDDQQIAIERLEREIHQVTHVKPSSFDKLLQNHKSQLLLKARTYVIGPGIIVAKHIAIRDMAYRVGNITPDNRLQFQICLSDAATDAMNCGLADMEYTPGKLQREIGGIASNDQKWFMKE